MYRSVRKTTLLVIAVALAVSSPPVTAQRGQNQPSSARSGIYIVQMIDPPSVANAGTPAFAATRPPRGQKIDPDSAPVVTYSQYLDRRHDEALAAVGGARKLYDYRHTLNGFAAELTAGQAEALKNVAGIVAVNRDELIRVDTATTPQFLGLTANDGLWNLVGGVGRAGEDIIIGDIDSGIWPESDSFSDRLDDDHHGNGHGKDHGKDKDKDKDKGGKRNYRHLPGWHGKCHPAEAWKRSDCNEKLIGARHFDAAWGGDAGLKEQMPWEYASPRDYNGHGTHTASTAGGNNNVETDGPAAAIGRVSGMAPRARISVYKALYSTQDASQASGFTSDIVAAVDQAVADGVDVINYSISGSSTNFLDAAEIAFLNAADAGIFVSASAGNSGPTAGTVAHPSPWITTVAAGTHNRDGRGSATLGNGTTYQGSSFASAVGSSPLINSTAAGLAGADPTALRLCFADVDNGGQAVLDPAKVSGKIVVCERGTNPRVNKSLAVQEAGGIGMILVNVTPASLNADFHFVPTVHLADTARGPIEAYAATPGATASIAKSTVILNVPAPFPASFSSRGPLAAGGGNLLKPDVIAPGQDILAAVAPPGNHGLSFNVYSGTSMSAPHVSGLGALLKQLHPDWSPMMIKSALMTTGTDVLDTSTANPANNADPTVIFAQGAGHVAPNSAANPGLVFDSDANDWLAFLCGTTNGVNPAVCSDLSAAGYSLAPSDMNTPSISIGAVPGKTTVTRRVTNVSWRNATYTASVTGMVGATVTVSPASLTVHAGHTKSFTVTITRTSAALNAYIGGQLTWSDGAHSVRIPIVARPVALSAPAAVSGPATGFSYPAQFGYSGAFAASARGLLPATTGAGTVTDDPGDSFSPTGPGVTAFTVNVPSGTTYARFSLFDGNVTPAGSDLDLYVYRGTTLVGLSGAEGSNEEVDLLNPPADTYTVYVHGFNVTPGVTANFTLYSWLLGGTSAGNMTVTAPATASIGGSGTVSLSFSGLVPGTRYLGSVAYGGIAGLPNPTIVRVDP
jgi:subtilisin family serine protease